MKNIIKDKKIIVSLIIILILILLFFFMFKREKNENNNILDNNVKKVTNNNFFINLDDFVKNIKKEYKEKESFQNCLAQDMGLKICLREEVNKKIKEKNNSDYCNDLVFQSDINNCLTDFKYQKVITSGVKEACKDLESKQNSCLFNLITKEAKNKNQEELCNQLVDEMSKDNCKREVIFKKARETLDEKICDRLSSVDKDMCLVELEMIKEQKKMENQINSEISA